MEKQLKSNNLTTAINLFIADIEKINKGNVERLKIKFNYSIDENLKSGRFIFDLKNAFGDEVLKIQKTLNQLIKERVINGFMSFSKNKAKILFWLWSNSKAEPQPKIKTIECFNCGAENTIRF